MANAECWMLTCPDGDARTPQPEEHFKSITCTPSRRLQAQDTRHAGLGVCLLVFRGAPRLLVVISDDLMAGPGRVEEKCPPWRVRLKVCVEAIPRCARR